MISPSNQTSQITPNWNKQPVTTSKDLSENLSLKLLRGAIFLLFSDQSDIFCFTIGSSQSDEYPWR